VTAEDINPVEKMASVFNVTPPSTQLEQLVDVEPVKDFQFSQNDTVGVFGNIGDVVNKNMPR
jgi:hypothetical protein